MSSPRSKNVIKLWTLLSVSTLVVICLSWVRAFDRIVEKNFERLLINLRKTEVPDPSIVIIEVDTTSKNMLGDWGKEWRQYHANLIRVLADDEASVVGFDICVPETSRYDSSLAAAIEQAQADTTKIIFGFGCRKDKSNSLIVG